MSHSPFSLWKFAAKVSLLSLAVLASAAGSALGAEVRECSAAGIDLTTVSRPVPQNVRAFYNGKITVFNYDTGEPAACSAGLAITLEVGTCYAVGCFGGIDVKQAKASYDSKKGLLLQVANSMTDPETGQSATAADVKIRVNLKNGSVTLE